MNRYPRNRAAASPSAGGQSPWPERDDELRRHWAAGTSTKKIGDAMHITKNAIVGRAHRLGLPPRPSPIGFGYAGGTGGERKTPARRTVMRKALPTLAELVNTEPAPPVASAPPASPTPHPPTHKSAEGLRVARQKAAEAARVEVPKQAEAVPVAPAARSASRWGCQYPLWGDNEPVPKPPRFCDAPCPLGLSWCATHRSVVFTRSVGWGQKAPTELRAQAGDSADALLDPA